MALSYQGLRSDWSPILAGYTEIPYPSWAVGDLTPVEREGARVFQLQGCHACHAIGEYGGQAGPSLSNVGERHEPEYLVITILRGRGNMPGFARTMSSEDLAALVAFLETLDGGP